MAITINDLCFGFKTKNTNLSNTSPFLLTDSVDTSTDFYFCSNILFLNQKRNQLGLPSINTKMNLIVFVCDQINNDIFETLISIKTYKINVLNDYVNSDITDSFFIHDDMCDSMSHEEILSLCKEYKVIFRISTTNDVDEFLKNGDIVNNVKIVLDTKQSGPYSVQFESVDMLNPQEFTNQERINSYQTCLSLFGFESIRVFYPKEALDNSYLMPMVCIQRGVGQEHWGYDVYASKLASYGYFVCYLFQETYTKTPTNSAGTMGDGNYHILGKLRHFKNNIGKIKNGKFQNKLNFDKITLMGHSQGGEKVKSACAEVGVNPSAGIDINSIMCLVIINGALDSITSLGTGTDYLCLNSNIPNTSFNLPKNIPILLLNSDRDEVTKSLMPTWFVNYGLNSVTLENEVPKRIIFIKNSQHGGSIIDHNFKNYINIPSAYNMDTRYFYTYNSRANNLGFVSSDLVNFLSLCLKQKTKNYLKITNTHSISPNQQKIRDFSYSLDHVPFSDVTLVVDKFNNVNPERSFGNLTFFLQTQDARDLPSVSDIFRGIVSRSCSGSSDGACVLTITQDSYLQFERSSFNLNNSNYIEVHCCMMDDPLNTNTENFHFCLELVDSLDNSSIISSSMMSIGIPSKTTTTSPQTDSHEYICAFPVKFNIKQLKQNNIDLDLRNITKIILRFGSSYGTSTGKIYINRIQATI